MKQTKWIVPAIVAVLAVSLVGCGKDAESGPGADESQNAASEPAELVFYSLSKMAEDNFNRTIGDPIRKKFPNYTVKYIQNGTPGTDLQALIAAGQPIDIYFESIGQYMDGIVKYDMAMDMSDLIKTHGVDLSRFEPSTIDSMKQMFDGKLLGLPYSNSAMVMYYNKDIFDKFGVPYPKDGMTWSDTLELGKRLSRAEDGKSYVGFSYFLLHLPRLNAYSLPFVDAKTNRAAVNNDQWKSFYKQVYADIANDAIFRQRLEKEKGNLLNLNVFIKSQDVAMFVDSLNANAVNPVPRWDMVSAPTLENAPGVGWQSYPGYLSITSTSKFKEQAMEAIKYLTSDEYQLESARNGVVSSLKSDAMRQALGESEGLKGKNVNALFVNKLAPIAPKTVFDPEADRLARADAVNIALGQIDVNSALSKAEEAINKYIDGELKK